MRRDEFFSIHAVWENRAETPASIAQRLIMYMKLARPAMPQDLRWYGLIDDEHFLDLDDNHDNIPEWIASKACTDDFGNLEPERGYLFSGPVVGSDPRGPKQKGSSMSATMGSPCSGNHFQFSLEVYADGPADPRLLNYDAVRAHLMAMAWSFQPAWCCAGPARLSRFLDHDVYTRAHVSLSWMVWLNPALAKLVEPPPRYMLTITEPYSDGSLFMATSKDVFDCDDDRHLMQARAIHRQIDPTNFTEPFNGQRGRNPDVPPFPKL